MKHYWPIGLREQIEGAQIGSDDGIALCGWCNNTIQDGDDVTVFIARRPDGPWLHRQTACLECRDSVVGIPTKGIDEVIVRASVETRPGYDSQLWLSLDTAAVLDRELPTEGGVGLPEEIEASIEASRPPTGE